jgi:hypothetical protein
VIILIDIRSVKQFVDAVKARNIVSQLPDGLKEHAQQFERIVLDDICTQAGVTMTEQEVLDLVSGISSDQTTKTFLSTIIDFIVSTVKKHYPTGLVSAIISYLVTNLIK